MIHWPTFYRKHRICTIHDFTFNHRYRYYYHNDKSWSILFYAFFFTFNVKENLAGVKNAFWSIKGQQILTFFSSLRSFQSWENKIFWLSGDNNKYYHRINALLNVSSNTKKIEERWLAIFYARYPECIKLG